MEKHIKKECILNSKTGRMGLDIYNLWHLFIMELQGEEKEKVD